jgi:hypothetical protein|tara:strand:- start:328 stop:513 length:186 start_codon:yes stop_codon:yes gene_type:complete
MTKKEKMFYTSDGVKIIGYSNAKEFNKALEEWTKKNQDLVKDYPEAVEKMKMKERDFNEKN